MTTNRDRFDRFNASECQRAHTIYKAHEVAEDLWYSLFRQTHDGAKLNISALAECFEMSVSMLRALCARTNNLYSANITSKGWTIMDIDKERVYVATLADRKRRDEEAAEKRTLSRTYHLKQRSLQRY
jgi:hypothetical protein